MLHLFRRSFTNEELKQCALLQGFDLFKTLSNEELVHFVPFCFKRTYKDGEVLFFRNDPSQALYLIIDGVVDISLKLGREVQILQKVGTYDVLGEECLLGADTKRIVNAIVSSDVATIYVIPRANVLEIMERYLGIKAKLMTCLAHNKHKDIAAIFKAYQASLGFFDLTNVYDNLNY